MDNLSIQGDAVSVEELFPLDEIGEKALIAKTNLILKTKARKFLKKNKNFALLCGQGTSIHLDIYKKHFTAEKGWQISSFFGYCSGECEDYVTNARAIHVIFSVIDKVKPTPNNLKNKMTQIDPILGQPEEIRKNSLFTKIKKWGNWYERT